MNPLQRSSVSFRRQGSSGRIWGDPLRGLEPKAVSGPQATIVVGNNQEEQIYAKKAVDTDIPDRISIPSSRPPKSVNNKVPTQRCALSAIFGRCMGSSPVS